jgi:hypothetical protein
MSFKIPVKHISTGFEGIAVKSRGTGTAMEYFITWDYDGSCGWYSVHSIALI